MGFDWMAASPFFCARRRDVLAKFRSSPKLDRVEIEIRQMTLVAMFS